MTLAAATGPDTRGGRLMVASAGGALRHMARRDLAFLLAPGDVVVANDAATLPTSLSGVHAQTGAAVELRLAAWVTAGDPAQFIAVAFGAGDHRTATEDRPPPPPLAPGDRLVLGPLVCAVDEVLGHPRLVAVRLLGDRPAILAGLARHGRPIQYAHVPAPLALGDVWTRLAAVPIAFEAPSAGFAVDWQTVAAWRRRGITVATLTHAAGISSTGDAALDRRLPFDEPYTIPAATAAAIGRAKATGRRVIAVGTTVVRALEAAARPDGRVCAGAGVARNRIDGATRLQVVDAIVTGMHQPGESHFELLHAFADRATLDGITAAAKARGYRAHEFGDSLMLARKG